MAGVIYEVKNRVAYVTMNGPENRNAMNEAMQLGLIDAFKKADAADDVSVILLSAAGDSFCAGGDLQLFKALRDRSATEVYGEARRSADLYQLFQALKKPIITAVNGPAFGGGFGVVCSSTIVLASDRAKFGCTEIKLGLFPLVILPAVRKVIGDRKTLELSLTGDVIDAAEALRLGAVNRVVPHDALMDEATALANRIASFSPHAIMLGLKAFNSTTDVEPNKAMEALLSLRAVFMHSEDVYEGASAFLEKRKPVWVGR